MKKKKQNHHAGQPDALNRYRARKSIRLNKRLLRADSIDEWVRVEKAISKNNAAKLRRMDADGEEEPARWITTENGHHVPLDSEGKAMAGGGGTLKGKDFSRSESDKRVLNSKARSKYSKSTGSSESANLGKQYEKPSQSVPDWKSTETTGSGFNSSKYTVKPSGTPIEMPESGIGSSEGKSQPEANTGSSDVREWTKKSASTNVPKETADAREKANKEHYEVSELNGLMSIPASSLSKEEFKKAMEEASQKVGKKIDAGDSVVAQYQVGDYKIVDTFTKQPSNPGKDWNNSYPGSDNEGKIIYTGEKPDYKWELPDIYDLELPDSLKPNKKEESHIEFVNTGTKQPAGPNYTWNESDPTYFLHGQEVTLVNLNQKPFELYRESKGTTTSVYQDIPESARDTVVYSIEKKK